jgi:hypothetical protein
VKIIGQNIYRRALVAAILIAATGLVVGVASRYLMVRWKSPAASFFYGLGTTLIMWMALSFASRKLFNDLVADAQRGHPLSPAENYTANRRPRDAVHRYPRSLVYLIALLGFLLVALPFLSAEPRRPIAIGTYCACFCAACMVFAIAVHLYVYSVAVMHDRVIIKGFVKRAFLLSDIAKSKIEMTKNGAQIVVVLKNGKTLRFGRMLTGFASLSATLIPQSSRAPD